MAENFPHNSLELYKSYALSQPLDIARIAALRLLRRTQPATAVLSTGGQMEVMLPEGVSAITFIAHDYEPDVTNALTAVLNPDSTFWNIGAHIGLRMAQAGSIIEGGQIYAFEPTPRTKKVLDLNAASIDSATTYPLALSDEVGRCQLQDFGWQFSGLNTINNEARLTDSLKHRVPQPHLVDVEVTTVDRLVAEGLTPPDVMSVDAEGSELKIFQGARHTLAGHHPVIIFEAGNLGESDTGGCIQFLRNLDYRLFESNGRLTPCADDCCFTENANLVAIHPFTNPFTV